MLPDPPTMTIPLQMTEDGDLRVSGTRVTLDVIIARYHQGETPETIHESFPTVPLNDIYAVIAYYLSNRETIDAYFKRNAEIAAEIRRKLEARLTPKQREFNERMSQLSAEKRRNREAGE